MPYTTETDVKLMYGEININRWADLDNTGVAGTISDRIDATIEHADDYINGRFAQSKYTVPFETDHVPKLIKFLATLYVGILLYDGRGQNATDKARDQVKNQRERFNRVLRQILSGQLTLTDPLSGEIMEFTSETTPFVEAIESRTESTCCDCPCNQEPTIIVGES